MSDKIFLDTNVIIYLYSEDEDEKRKIICEQINSNYCITSTQVLNEASNVWLKKYAFTIGQVKTYLDGIEAVCDEILLIHRKTINQALNIKDRYGYSYYDSLVLASALESNCKTIITEDMSDGQIIFGSLEIANPFQRRFNKNT